MGSSRQGGGVNAPAWDETAKIKAAREKQALIKVYIQGKHTGNGTYGVSMAMPHENAMLLAAICNLTASKSTIPAEVYHILGVVPPGVRSEDTGQGHGE